MPVPLCRPQILGEALERLTSCLASGWIGYGPVCKELESRFTALHGGWALATGSCTAALYLAAQLCRRTQDDEVVVPAITFVSTPMAFAYAGWRVRFADVDPESLLATPSTIAARLTPRTRAVVVVHTYGQRADVESIRALCDERGLTLIEDCAHRLDLLDERSHLGDYVCYSFNAVKEVPCGEGGLLWGSCDADLRLALVSSNVGLGIDTWQRSATTVHADYMFTSQPGLKLRLSDVQASLAIGGLDALAATRNVRRTLFQRYNETLSRFEECLMPLSRSPSDSYLMYVVRLTGAVRDGFRESLARRGVATSIHYPCLTSHPLFRQVEKCPIAEQAATDVLTLPCYPSMTADEVELVLNGIESSIGAAHERLDSR